MADLRVLHGVKIVDADTPANSVTVSAAGNLATEITIALPTGANTIGAVNLAQAETDDAAVSVGGTVLMSGLVFDDITPVIVEEGDAGYQRMSSRREAYMQLRDAAGNERGVNVTASNELNVIATAQPGVDIGDVDVLSVIPGTGATSLGKAEDAAHGDGDTGVMMLAVRRDADTTMVTADNDYSPLQVDATGRLKVETQGGAGGTSSVDDAAFTTGTDSLTPVGGIFDDTAPNNLEENDVGVVRMTANRAMHTALRDGAGNERSANVTASNELNVIATAQPGVDIGDVDVLSVIPGTGGTNLGKAENAASAGGDTGVATMAVQDAALTALASIDGDYTQLRVDANGALWVIQSAALPAGDNNIGNVDIVTGPTGASALEMQGTAADGAAAVGDPVQVGGTEAGGNMQTLRTDADGHLQVDVLTGGGSDTPTNPVRTHSSSTDTAVAATFNADGPESGGTTTKLAGFDVSASVPVKIEVQTVANGAGTTVDVLFAQAGEKCQWRPPHRNYYSVAHPANAGFDGFRLAITNLDNENAANLYGTLYTED
jgi:hypothetical protein